MFLNAFGHSRPVVTIDYCHLKGAYQGNIFAVSCLDGYNFIFPISFGMLNQEDTENWSWILINLKFALSPLPPDCYLVSDRQNGHNEAFKFSITWWTDAHCVLHIVDNLKARFKCNKFETKFIWSVAKTLDVDTFNTLRSDNKFVNEVVYQYLVDPGPDTWPSVKFPGKKCVIVTQNTSESSNAWLGSADRALPSLCLIKTILLRSLKTTF